MPSVLAIIAFMLLAAMPVSAKDEEPDDSLELAPVFTDGMVIQRDTAVTVWGWAEPGCKVTVRPSWTRKKYSAVADEAGNWKVGIETPPAGGPHTIRISGGGNEIILDDVMSGEVWLCTGQSNMFMTVEGYPAQRTEGNVETILEAPEYEQVIRVFNITGPSGITEPQDRLEGRWERTDGKVTARTSAIAYHFAKNLTKRMNVPVGIITAAWGGCMLEPWISQDYLVKSLEGKVSEERMRTILARRDTPDNAPSQVGTMYNARLWPIRNYAIKGFLWYQGCSNLGDYEYYGPLQAGMVRCWRDMWGDERNAMPFYFVAIAPYYFGSENPDALPRAYFVEKQMESVDLIPNSAIAITETLGFADWIHPAKKIEVARQLSQLAIERTYGIETGLGSGFPYPVEIRFPANSKVETGVIRRSGFDIKITKSANADGKIHVYFANTGAGVGQVYKLGGSVTGFTVAGPDKVFRKARATATGEGNHIIIDDTGISNPVAVRYSFCNVPDGNLTSNLGVPVPMFRTDDWE